jgi:signal transduction histidine kinase
MSWQHTIYVYPIVFSTLLALGMGVHAARIRRRSDREQTLLLFAALSLAVAVWTGFAALKLASTDPGVKLLAYRLLHVGSSATAPLLLLFVIWYTDRRHWIRPSVVAGLFAVPAAFVTLLFLDPGTLVIADRRVIDVGGVAVQRTDTGPAHVVLSAVYTRVLGAATLGLIGLELYRQGRSYLPQATLLTIAILTPVTVGLLTEAGVPPFDLDSVNYVPASTAISVAALGVAVWRYELLDLPPIAYRTAVRYAPDGVIVLDTDHRIVHANPRAETLLGGDSPIRGEQIASVLTQYDPSEWVRLPQDATMVTADRGRNGGNVGEGSHRDREVQAPDRESGPASGIEATSGAEQGGVSADSRGTEPGDDTEGSSTAERGGGVEDRGVEQRQGVIERRTAAGEEQFLEVRTQPLERAGELVGWVLGLRDVTERRRRERELEAFTGIVSHDLRQPMRTVEQYLQILEDDHGEALDEDGRELLSVARRNSAMMQSMISDLREYSRIQREDTAFGPVDTEPVVGAVIEANRFEIEDRDASIEVGDLPTVHGSEHLLQRLFQNLLANALEHAGEAPEIRFSARREDGTWAFAVSDDGRGIDRNAVGDLFELFTRGPGADADGTGMGLAIAERIVQEHGGSIEVDSAPGEGTTVRFTIPAQEE